MSTWATDEFATAELGDARLSQRPHLVKTFKESRDPKFVEKLEDNVQ